MKWDLDLWYELWDRAGSQGLDTWYDPRGGDLEGPASDHKQDTESPDAAQEGAPGGLDRQDTPYGAGVRWRVP
jgi:hypothetical protein